jgi:phosphate uptake regulator
VVKDVKRKLQVTGGSTHVISIPIEWIKKMGLNKGDEVNLVLRDDNTILIGNTGRRSIAESRIELSNKDLIVDNIYRKIVALYLAGIDVIRIIFERDITNDCKKGLKDKIREQIMGLEVIEESSKEMVLRCFINHEDFPLDKAVNGLKDMTESMLSEMIYSLKERKIRFADDIIQRDNEINRFYLLIVRQLKEALDIPEIGKKVGISKIKNILEYRVLMKSIERICDHIKNIAKNFIILFNEMPYETDPIQDSLLKTCEKIQNILSASLISLTADKMSIKESNKVIQDTKEIIEEIDEDLYEKILKKYDDAVRGVYNLSIVDSLTRITEYIQDIEEIKINITSS